MTIKGLTNKQHQNVLRELIKLGETTKIKQLHASGPEYTSLMVCFLKHSLSSADCLQQLYAFYGDDLFPTTVGYTIVRPMFEIDVTAHYITRKPRERAHQYIEYESVIKKRQMEAWGKHRNSNKPDWREAMETAWQHELAERQSQIDSRFNSIRTKFEKINKKGHPILFHNWSGKSIRDMAVEVDHEEAYDIFYADLSSFTHADVRLANRFLRLNTHGMSWSSQAQSPDIGGVFRYADIFLTCFLSLFGEEFKLWEKSKVEKCWG